MSVRAKLRVQSIQHIATSSPTDVCAEIKLHAVYGDGKGNETWSKATPQGELKMLGSNPAAIEAFELGKSYYLDFSLAD